MPSQTSIPETGTTRYEDILPLTMTSKDGERLVIGTQILNALVTSSSRLDRKEPPSLEGKTVSFVLKDEKDSYNTRIYLDKGSVEMVFGLENGTSDGNWSYRNKLEQLRQVRSKFHELSTYNLSRAWSPLTPACTMQPYNLFTLANSSTMEKRAGRAAAILFNKIAIEVIDK
ncbi:hypothetical protein BGX21_004939, partial [Mortierella sp. AD011]